jgi:hypothetical protein
MRIPKNAIETAKNSHWCKLQLTDEDAYKILEGGARHARLRDIGQEHLTKSGAKLYPQGGGWYNLSGYHYDGQDVLDDLIVLANPVGTRYVRLHAMRYALKRNLQVIAGKNPSRAEFPEKRYLDTDPAEFCRRCVHMVEVPEHISLRQYLTTKEK